MSKNVKVYFIKTDGYANLKEWTEDPQNIYIGRAGVVIIDGKRFPKAASPFSNPFKVGKDGTKEEVLDKYRKYIEDKIEKSPTLFAELQNLKGKNLGCWCAHQPCHGDILLELIEKYC